MIVSVFQWQKSSSQTVICGFILNLVTSDLNLVTNFIYIEFEYGAIKDKSLPRIKGF